jgi:hypothetical protein
MSDELLFIAAMCRANNRVAFDGGEMIIDFVLKKFRDSIPCSSEEYVVNRLATVRI